eukprot:10385887-Karenia_brevis.AAC.3
MNGRANWKKKTCWLRTAGLKQLGGREALVHVFRICVQPDPVTSTSVPKDQASVPKDWASVPKNRASVPKDLLHAKGPCFGAQRDRASVPKDWASVPKDQTSVPRGWAWVPKDQALVPKGCASRSTQGRALKLNPLVSSHVVWRMEHSPLTLQAA